MTLERLQDFHASFKEKDNLLNLILSNTSPFYASNETFGLYDYNDLATETVPIPIVADTWTHVTNDGLGINTLKLILSGVSNVYNIATSLFDFSDLSIDRSGEQKDYQFTETHISSASDPSSLQFVEVTQL